MDKNQMKLAEELLFAEKTQLSFVKQLFFGRFDAKAALPYPEEVGEGDFFNRLDAFLVEELDPKAIDRESSIPSHVIRGLSKLGVLGMTVPKEYGGLGMSQSAYCKATEKIAALCASTALFVNVHQSIGLRALLIYGTEEQKEKWLKPMAKGEKIGAFALTEPNAGSDASAVETTAVYDSQNKIYRINGQKQWITNGGIADVLTVMAKTHVSGKERITAFLVTPDMPGFKVLNPSLEKLGVRGTKTGNLLFQNLEVPEENILGNLGEGLKVALTTLDYGRTTFGALCTGVAKDLQKRAIDRAKNRHQFGRPIGSFSLVKKKIAKIASLTYAMDAATYLTAGMIDKQEDDFMLESAILKVFTSEALWEIVYETMQIWGGKSYFTDEPLERMMRDARINMIGEGANEVLRVFIAAVGMRDAGEEMRAGLLSLKNPFSKHALSFFSSMAKKLTAPDVPIQSSELKEYADKLSKEVRTLGQDVVRLLSKHKEQIVERQLILDRIATIAIALYTATAVLRKMDRTGKKEEARYFLDDAWRRIACMRQGLHKNHDREIETLSDKLLDL